MWHRSWTVAAILGCATVPAAHAQEGKLIGEVVVRGLKNTNETVVTLAAQTAGVRPGAVFSSASVAKARESILGRGLYASVLPRTEETADRRIRVVFDVIENPVISSISLAGVHVLKAEDLLKVMETKPGQILNKKTLASDILKIQRLYTANDFRAIVAEEFSFDPKTGVLTIPVLETIVESIDIEGLQKTQKAVVIRELQTKVGKPYNDRLLNEDLSRLMALQIFVNVESLPPDPGSDLDKVRIKLVATEQKTGQVGLSVGYSASQRLTGTVSLNEQNFRGRAEGLDLQWTVAGGISRNSFEIGFTEPWIDSHNTSLGVSVYDRFAFRFNRLLSSSYTDGTSSNQYFEERRGGSVRLSRPLTRDRFTRAFTSFRAESVRANNLQQNYSLLSDDDIRNLRGSLVQNGDVSAVSTGIISNPVDNALDPSRGYYFSPSLEVGNSRFDYQKPRLNPAYDPNQPTTTGPRLFVDDRSQQGAFVKYSLDARWYRSLNGARPKDNLRAPRKILASRLLLGTAVGNIAFSEQYFMGGPDNLRGYFDDRYWGNNQFLFANELRLPLDKQNSLGGVFFVDIGDAWGASNVNAENIAGFEQHRNFKPRVGWGVGIRVRTPVGPVRLDYGFGNGQGRSHFSIGQAF